MPPLRLLLSLPLLFGHLVKPCTLSIPFRLLLRSPFRCLGIPLLDLCSRPFLFFGGFSSSSRLGGVLFYTKSAGWNGK
jgi:hypothetical protein